MPHIAVSAFTGNTPGDTVVGIIDVTKRTLIDGQPSNVLTEVVIGFGVTDSTDLRDAIWEATKRLVAEYKSNVSQEEKDEKIKELREKNDASTTVSFSRQCHICASPNPEIRAVLTACGHSLCMACVLTLSKKGRLLCPFCRKSTAYVKLHEDIAEEKEKEEKELEKEADTIAETLSKVSIAPSYDMPISTPLPTTPPTRRSPHSTGPRHGRPTSPNSPTSPANDPSIEHRQELSSSHGTTSLPTPHSVTVSNLPRGVTESDLRTLFNQQGQLINIEMLVNHFGGNWGHCYCVFVDEESARDFRSKYDGFEFNGHILRITSPFDSSS